MIRVGGVITDFGSAHEPETRPDRNVFVVVHYGAGRRDRFCDARLALKCEGQIAPATKAATNPQTLSQDTIAIKRSIPAFIASTPEKTDVRRPMGG
jgi:hypothetical protein